MSHDFTPDMTRSKAHVLLPLYMSKTGLNCSRLLALVMDADLSLHEFSYVPAVYYEYEYSQYDTIALIESRSRHSSTILASSNPKYSPPVGSNVNTKRS